MQRLGALVRLSAGRPALALQRLDQAKKARDVCVDAAPQKLHLRRGHGIPAHAPGIGAGADLKPESRTVAQSLAVSRGEPQMILIRAPAEEASCVPVDAGDVRLTRKIRKTGVHQRDTVRRESLEGRVDKILKFLLVGKEPGTLIVEGELPQKAAGFFAEA